MDSTATRKRRQQPDVVSRRLSKIKPSPENDKLYKPVDPNDPSIIALAASMEEHGVKEPLVIDRDGWIISGHRRHCAAGLAGLDRVPCRVEPIRRIDDIDAFVRLLRTYNEQRVKSFAEKVRESVLDHDPYQSYESLLAHRDQSSVVSVPTIALRETKVRCKISKAKRHMVDAVLQILEERRQFWPLSDRGIHYPMLNIQPLMHASKPNSTYTNTPKCYKNLVDLLARGRLAGIFPWEAIADATRPVTIWRVHDDVSQFVGKEVGKFCKNYWRNVMQSQPNHVEVVGEKNTVDSILKQVVMKYRIPLTTGRGFCSLPPRKEMADRFHQSGKERLIVIFVSDFDADGEEIAHSFARSMRDDFGIEKLVPIKAALTLEQVERYQPPLSLEPKKLSANYEKFIERYGRGQQAYELEAISPDDLQAELTKVIDSVIDHDAFNAELDAEREDSTHLAALRETVSEAMADLDF